MGCYGAVWESYGAPWAFYDESLCVMGLWIVEYYGAAWEPKGCYEAAWEPYRCYGAVWVVMGLWELWGCLAAVWCYGAVRDPIKATWGFMMGAL